MNKMSFVKKVSILTLVLGVNAMMYANKIDLGNPGQALMEQLEKWFPWLAAAGFFFAGWRAWDSYQENGKDVMAGMKIMLFYALLILVFVAVYKYVKNLSL